MPGRRRAELVPSEQGAWEQGLLPELGPSSKLGLMELGQLLLELCLQLELQRRVQLQRGPCG